MFLKRFWFRALEIYVEKKLVIRNLAAEYAVSYKVEWYFLVKNILPNYESYHLECLHIHVWTLQYSKTERIFAQNFKMKLFFSQILVKTNDFFVLIEKNAARFSSVVCILRNGTCLLLIMSRINYVHPQWILSYYF